MALLLVTGLCGCDSGDRPDLGHVTGTVTLDGQPLADTWVTFVQRGYRPSSDMTDADGRYDLRYLRDIRGATLGIHTVRIEKEPAEEGKPALDPLPVRYNRESKIQRTVESGENVFDFELTTGDPVPPENPIREES